MGQEDLGLMASLSEDQVLGINDIKEKKEEESEIDSEKKHTDKVVILVKDREESEGGGQGERDMAHPTGNSIHRSSSRPQLDLSKAAIQGNFEERDPTILLPNQSDDISHLALDIGGMLHLTCVFFFFFKFLVDYGLCYVFQYCWVGIMIIIAFFFWVFCFIAF